MNYEDIMKSMVRKYAFEESSRAILTDEERISHIVAEAQYMVARKYGFRDAAEMDEALIQRDGKWQDYTTSRSKHFSARGA